MIEKGKDSKERKEMKAYAIIVKDAHNKDDAYKKVLTKERFYEMNV
jgi:hypothetical protein